MSEHPTGEQLYEELCAEAARRGVPVKQLVRQLWRGEPGRMIDNLRMSKTPFGRTVERVRGLIAGQAIELTARTEPSSPYLTIRRDERRALGLASSDRERRDARSLARTIRMKAKVERRRTICRQATERRLPGETLQAAAARLERERTA